MIAKNKERITITMEKKVLVFVRNKSIELECTASEYINNIIKKELNFNARQTI